MTGLKMNINFYNIDRFQGGIKLLDTLYFHDAGLKLVVGNDGPVLDPGLIGIDGIDRIFEYLGDLVVVGDAHADQGKDPEVDVEQFVLFQLDLVFGFEEGIEAGDELGEDA